MHKADIARALSRHNTLRLMSRPRWSAPFPKAVDDDRANFTRKPMRGFLAADCSCELRQNASNDPLCGLSISGGDGWPPITGRCAIRSRQNRLPTASSIRRGDRGKRTIARSSETRKKSRDGRLTTAHNGASNSARSVGLRRKSRWTRLSVWCAGSGAYRKA